MARKDVRSAQLEHTIETAEKAISAAQRAERMISQASTGGEPRAVAQAEQNLKHAQHEVNNAIEHLQNTADEHREQQVVQVLDQLYAAKVDLESAHGVISTPKQIR